MEGGRGCRREPGAGLSGGWFGSKGMKFRTNVGRRTDEALAFAFCYASAGS